MCEYCHQYICPSGCPNARESDPEIFARCDSCGTKIYDGEEYYELNGQYFCEDCVEEGRKIAEVK